VGTNRRYGDKLQAQSLERMQERPAGPVELPLQAHGPRPIEWTHARTPVWVWCQFPDRPAERVRGYVKGSNDRVCIVHVEGPGGGWERTVWRNAVTHRRDDPAPASTSRP
jgi:hypothetical protein